MGTLMVMVVGPSLVQRLAVGGWWLVAFGGWWGLVVGSWWRLAAVGGWRLVVPGGAVLCKKNLAS